MASRYQEQSLPIKLMTISNAEDVRRNSNRHPTVSASLSGPHSIYGGSNGECHNHLSHLKSLSRKFIFKSSRTWNT